MSIVRKLWKIWDHNATDRAIDFALLVGCFVVIARMGDSADRTNRQLLLAQIDAVQLRHDAIAARTRAPAERSR